MENLFCPICGSRRVSPAANGIYMCASCDNAFSFTKEVTYAKTILDQMTMPALRTFFFTFFRFYM